MIPELAIKWALGAILTIVLSGGAYSVYSNIKQSGYDEAEAKYTLVISKQQAVIDTKLKNVEIMASTLVAESRESTALLVQDISTLTKVRGKTLTIIKEGKCTPTPELSSTINAINKRINESMKEVSK